MVCGDWEQPVLVGRKAHFRTALSWPCLTVGLSERRQTVEDSGRTWSRGKYCRTDCRTTVGLSDCRTVGLSELSDYCRTTVGFYCRTVGPGLSTQIRNELELPLTLALCTRSHPFFHGHTEEDLVRVPIQERVPCGHHSERERYLHFALSVANEGKKFRSRRTPY